MIIDKYGRGCTSDTQDPWRRQQADIQLDNILQHEAGVNTFLEYYIIYIYSTSISSEISFMNRIFRSSSRDSIRPSFNAGALSLARVERFPLYPNKNWGTSTYTTRKMLLSCWGCPFPTRQNWRFLTDMKLPTIQGTLRSNTSWCAWCIRPAEIIFPKIVKSKTHLEINMFPCTPERWVWGSWKTINL